MTRVIVADNIAALRTHVSGLVAEIVPDAQIIEAADGRECLELFQQMRPSLTVMDIAMPVVNGIAAAKSIWQQSPQAKILFWSQYQREVYVREIGRMVPDECIHGYVLKSEEDSKVKYAIESVLLHNNPFIDPLIRGIQSRIAKPNQAFSDEELVLLQDMYLGLTDRAIAARRHISIRGVQNRIIQLESKLLMRAQAHFDFFNTRSRTVAEALRRGLIDADELQQLELELCEWMSSYESEAA